MAEIMSKERDLQSLTLGKEVRLEDLVDRETLHELTRSFYQLFGITLRLFSAEGALLTDGSEEEPLCRYLNTLPQGRSACARTIASVKRMQAGEPGQDESTHPCFTGAQYHVVRIDFDGRYVGRMILGPYLPLHIKEPPQSLLSVDPGLDSTQTHELLHHIPRTQEQTIARLAEHLRAVLDMIFFAGYKALLTSQMHVATVRESFRELQDKNQRLEEAVERLQEMDRLKSNFLATVSHELRTPLTSIIGYSEMLTEGIGGELQGAQREFVETIHDKGEQLLSLIVSLLDLSKLESGTMSLKKSQFAVYSVLKEVVSTLLPTARKKGVILEAHAVKGVPDLYADEEKVRQIFLNLTENSLKFTDPGGRVKLEVRLCPSEAQPGSEGFVLFAANPAALEVRVSDTGIGIPPSQRIKVFKPFYQIDSSPTRRFGGTGLGLSIVKKLVEAHNGSISIMSNTPVGTVVSVLLPLPST